MEPLKISVIIPVKPSGAVKALGPLCTVDYPQELFEILVAEGCRPSAQRNAAAALASGDILYFLDDDSLVDPHFLHRVADHYLKDPAVVAVGGPSLTPEDDTLFQKSAGAVLASAFGGGGNRNRYRLVGKARQTDDAELILCNLSFRRDVFLSFGGLDERLYPNEENELMGRLKNEGRLLIHDPSLAVMRSQRPSYRAFVKQIFGYGRGRAEQVHVSREIKVFTLAPSLFILYLLLIPVFIATPYVIPLLVYLAMDAFFSLLNGTRKGTGIACLAAVLYPTLHICYGAGFIAGLIRPRFRWSIPCAGEITIRRIKDIGRGWQSAI
nr:glycosyltransferase [Geotalea sp. SG265]